MRNRARAGLPGSGALSTIVGELAPIETHRLSRGQFDDDVERIARRLSGRSVGVVLSGSGARAFAHIGALEELPLSFMCGCAELRSGALVIARSGPLWESVGFSINIPVLSAPQVRGRDLFVDGSLIDNLPVAAMADMGEGPIIAVDVKATSDPAAHQGGASAAADSRRPSPATSQSRLPSLGETLVRVLLLASQNSSQAA